MQFNLKKNYSRRVDCLLYFCNNDIFCPGFCLAPVVKQGKCPSYTACKWNLHRCSSDFHCKGNRKCCWSWCGRRCVKPGQPISFPGLFLCCGCATQGKALGTRLQVSETRNYNSQSLFTSKSQYKFFLARLTCIKRAFTRKPKKVEKKIQKISPK